MRGDQLQGAVSGMCNPFSYRWNLQGRVEQAPGTLRSHNVEGVYAKKIYELAATEELEIQKPDLPLITQKSEISDFIGERSRLLFDLLNIPLDFLADDEWYLLPEYASVKKSLKHLTPLNDSAERAFALATRVNTHITRDEESYQELLQVVEAHRKKYGLKTKDDLKKLY